MIPVVVVLPLLRWRRPTSHQKNGKRAPEHKLNTAQGKIMRKGLIRPEDGEVERMERMKKTRGEDRKDGKDRKDRSSFLHPQLTPKKLYFSKLQT